MSSIFPGITDRYGAYEALDQAALMDIYDTLQKERYAPPTHSFPRFCSDYSNACEGPGGSQLATTQLVSEMAMGRFPTYRASIAAEPDPFFHGLAQPTPVQATIPSCEESVPKTSRDKGLSAREWVWMPILVGVIGSAFVGGAAFVIGVAVALVAYGVFGLIDMYQRYSRYSDETVVEAAPLAIDRQEEPEQVFGPAKTNDLKAFEAVIQITSQILEIESTLNNPSLPAEDLPNVQKSLSLMLVVTSSDQVRRDCDLMQEQYDRAVREEQAIVNENVDIEMKLRGLGTTDARVEQLGQEREKVKVAFAAAAKRREACEEALKTKKAQLAIAEARAGN